MTIKEKLLKEIETIPPSMLKEILNFVQFIKAKHPQEDFMNFAGMAREIDDVTHIPHIICPIKNYGLEPR